MQFFPMVTGVVTKIIDQRFFLETYVLTYLSRQRINEKNPGLSDSPSIRFSKYPILQVSDSTRKRVKKKHYLKMVFLKTLCGVSDKERIKSDSPSIRSPSKRILR